MAVDYGDIAMIKRMLASTGTTYDANTDARLAALNTSISRVLEHVLGRSFGTAPPPEGTTRLVYGRGSDMLFLPTPAWLIASVSVGGAGEGDPRTGGTRAPLAGRGPPPPRPAGRDRDRGQQARGRNVQGREHPHCQR